MGRYDWGHAISPDLISWKHLTLALPGTNTTMAFSGSPGVGSTNTSNLCHSEDVQGCLIAIYTAHKYGFADGHVEQAQNIAVGYGGDAFPLWQNYQNNPVLQIVDSKSRREISEFRDPKVFCLKRNG